MGSAKYPDENDFDAFIKRHGGSNNAYTDCERVSYVSLSCSHTEHEANQTVREVCKFHYWLTSRSFWLSSYLSVSTSPYYVVTSWPPRKFLNIPKISTRRLTYIHSCPLRIHYWLTSRSSG